MAVLKIQANAPDADERVLRKAMNCLGLDPAIALHGGYLHFTVPEDLKHVARKILKEEYLLTASELRI